MLQAAGGNAATWLKGPVAIEWLLSGPPVDEAGQADPDLCVQFQVRHYPQTGSTRVSAVVEKCSDGSSDGGLIYGVTFRRGLAKPEVVFQQKNVRQPDLTRFRKVFWIGIGPAPADVVVRHDARTLAAAVVIPQYDLSSMDNTGDLAHYDNPGSYCDLALGASAIGVRIGHASARQVYDFLRANAKNITARRASHPCFAFGTEPVD